MTHQRTTRATTGTTRGAKPGLEGLEGEPGPRRGTRRVSSVMDLEEATGRGLLLETPGYGARATLDEALELLATREVRVRGPLLAVLRGEQDEVLSAIACAGGQIRQRGQRPSSLELAVPARSREGIESALAEARSVGLSLCPTGSVDQLSALLSTGVERIQRVVVVAPSPTRSEPQQRAELLVLARICRARRVELSLHGAALVDDLVFCRQLGVRAASGPVFGGASRSVPAASALHRRLITAAAAITDGDAPHRIHETARDLADLRRRAEEDVDTRDLAAVTRELERSLAGATRTAARARALRERAEEMLRRAEDELAAVLEGVATGEAPRAERIERCDDSYREARALFALAQAEVARAESSAVVTEAGAELRRRSIASALDARRARRARTGSLERSAPLAG